MAQVDEGTNETEKRMTKTCNIRLLDESIPRTQIRYRTERREGENRERTEDVETAKTMARSQSG